MTAQTARTDTGRRDDWFWTSLTWDEVRNEFLGFYSPPLRPKSTFFSGRRALDVVEELVARPTAVERGLDIADVAAAIETALDGGKLGHEARVGLRRAVTAGRIKEDDITEAIALLLTPEPADFTPTLVTRYCSRTTTKDGDPISLATVRGQLSYFRLFCAYAVKRGFLRDDPTLINKVWLPSDAGSDHEPDDAVTSRRFAHFSRVEVANMLGQVDREAAQGSWKSGRLQALVYLLAYLGLRKKEALGLKVADIDFREGCLVIRKNRRRRLKTKGSEAYLPLPKPLKTVLRRWMCRCGGVYVIPCEDVEKPWLSGGPSSRPLEQLRALGKRAGVKGVNFKKWRATFATHAESLWGWSDGEIQRILRHTSPLTAKQFYRFGDLANLRNPMDRVSFEPRKSRARALR